MKGLLHSMVLPVVLLSACGGSAPPPQTVGASTPSINNKKVEIPLVAKSDSKVSGKATFTEVDGGVEVAVEVAGAPPGKVATHVHEKGDCSAPDAKSAGEHFNPTSSQHGLPSTEERHLGDLGNIEVKPDGTGSKEIVVKGATLESGVPTSFLGRSIIVHEKRDDGAQPSGDAGGRIACGVILSR